MEWQPMISAPKDGSWLLAYIGHDLVEYAVMRWAEDDEDDNPGAEWRALGGVRFVVEPIYWAPLSPPSR